MAKRALVLSGGGGKGAYQAGALLHLMGAKKRRYEIVCGTSIGAINAAVLCQYKLGEEVEAAQELVRLWKSIRQKDVFRSWRVFGKLAALWKSSVYDSSPSRKFLERELDESAIRESGKRLSVGAVSLSDGEGGYHVYDETAESITDAVIASGAFPGFLSPVSYDGQLFTDGGVRNHTPISQAIRLGANCIDVIMTGPYGVVKPVDGKPNALDVLKAAVEILVDEVVQNDISQARLINEALESGTELKRNVRKVEINVLRPDEELGDTLDFSAKQKIKLIALGERDAREWSK